MGKYAAGSIPEKILYVHSVERSVRVGCAWDFSYEAEEKDKNPMMTVFPSFPVDSLDESIKAKAIAWASQGGYDHTTGKRIVNEYQIVEVDNKPIIGVQVLSLEERGNGGRAYKVVIDGKYYVDMREDVMMDAIIKVGISPGGILNGEFIWVKAGSQTKLVRIGSELHRLVLEFDSKKDLKPVKKRELEFGALYKDRKNNMAVFLGYVNTTNYNYVGEVPTYYNRSSWKANFNFQHTFFKKQMLFFEINAYDGLEKCLAEMKNEKRNYGYRIRKSHVYLEKVKDVEVPHDITDFLRKQARHEIKDIILEYTGTKTSQYKRDDWSLMQSTCSLSKMLNLYPFEGKPVELFDIKKFLLFS